MTLVLSCLTREFAVLVSDRRLVTQRWHSRNSSAVEVTGVLTDSTAKLLLWSDHMVFGYSGLAELDCAKNEVGPPELDGTLNPRSLPLWIADRMYGMPDLGAALERVIPQLEQAVARTALPPQMRGIAIVGVGWDCMDGSEELVPLELRIDNVLDENWQWQPLARPQFSVIGTTMLPTTRFLFSAIGAPLAESAVTRTKRVLDSVTLRDPHPWSIVRILARRIREVADHNAGVGRSLLATILPRPPVISNTVGFCGDAPRPGIPGIPDQPTFYHLPVDSQDWTHTSPVLASPHIAGFAVTSNFPQTEHCGPTI